MQVVTQSSLGSGTQTPVVGSTSFGEAGGNGRSEGLTAHELASDIRRREATSVASILIKA